MTRPSLFARIIIVGGCLCACAVAFLPTAARSGNAASRVVQAPRGDRVETRAGALELARTAHGPRVTLGGREVEIDGEVTSFAYVATLADADVVLVELSGGSACPSVWTFVIIPATGEPTHTGTFGTCSPKAPARRSGESLQVTVSAYGANPAQKVVYSAGIMSCDTCLPEISKGPVTVDGRRVAIRRTGGRDELVVGGATTGVTAEVLFIVEPALRLGSSDVLLVQKMFVAKDCETMHLVVRLDPDGKHTVTDDFGNCTGYPSVDARRDRIYVGFPAVEGQRSARFVYRDGKVVPLDMSPR